MSDENEFTVFVAGDASRIITEAWVPTAHLQWRTVPHTTTEPARLQQFWTERVSGRSEWRDVPLVVKPAHSPGDGER